MNTTKHTGFSLVELMVAISLGVVMTVTVLASYIATSRSMAEDERYALMQENGRYALKVLSEDLAMVDFWGQMINTTAITTTLAVAGANCATEPNLLDPTSALMFNNYHVNAITAAPPDVHFTPCSDVTDDHQAGTDIVVIKRVEGSPTEGAAISDAVYLRTNGTTGTLIDDADVGAPIVGESDWRYVPRMYYVRDHNFTAGDGIPSLCRMDLVLSVGSHGFGELTNPATLAGNFDEPTCLAEGVEDIHLQFGVDTDLDGVANQYFSAPTIAQMESVVTVRIYLLMRSATVVPYYTNSKSYQLGDVAIAAPNDGFLRRVYSTTVSLRNPTSLNLLNG